MKIIDIPQSLLDLIALRVDGDQPWGEPSELKFELKPVEPFEASALLPEVLRRAVMDGAYRMQCPPEFVAVSSLVMIGSVIGAGCAVRPKQKDDWTETPNLWGGIVGRPGLLKTPAIEAGMAAIAWLEDDARSEHEGTNAEYMRGKLDMDSQLKILKSDKGAKKMGLDEQTARNRLLELAIALDALEPPTMRRYRTNDATIEKTGELVRDNPRGLLYMRDELVGLLANCEKPGHEGDRSFFLEAWNGRNAFAVDRISRGSIVIPRLCLSLFGGIQPAKLQGFISATVDGYSNDGLLQRFQLMVYPDEIPHWKYVDEKPDADAKQKIVEIVRKLANTDFVSLGAEPDGEIGIPYFRFCESAQPVFVEWLGNLEVHIRDEENPVIAEHLSKYRKLVPALALIFHLVELAAGKAFEGNGISKEALERAIAWAKYLESHARRIYGMALDPVRPAVDALAAKIRSGKLEDGFSERDVYKACWMQLNDRDVVNAACCELELDGWIRRIPPQPGPGRPQSPAYLINPALKPK